MEKRPVQIYLLSLIFSVFLHAAYGQGVPHDRLVIDDVIISGNKVTKRNIFLRELTFTPGDTIDKMEMIPLLEKSRENIKNLSLFNIVEIDVDHKAANHIDVLISVVERWYIWPTPIFEHGERNLSTFLKEPKLDRLNYGMWLKWNNFRGRNEILNLKVRLGYKEQYVLQYEKPNLGKSENHKIFLSYSLSRQHRLNYITLSNKPEFFRDEEAYAFNSADAFFAYSYRPGLYSRHRIRFHYVDDWISDSIAFLNPGYFGQGYSRHKYFKIDYVFLDDRRDSKIYPLDGYAYKIKLIRTGLGIIEDFPYGNWEAEAVSFYHKRLNDRFFIADITKGKVGSNKDVPLFEKKALGYAENLMAYDKYVIDGTDYLINKFIFKYQLMRPTPVTIPFLDIKQFSKAHLAIYLNFFADAGFVNNKFPHVSNYMDNVLQYSAGLGIDFVTYYDKVLGFGLAINRYGTREWFFYATTPFFEW